MTSVLVPTVDLAPGMPSRVVTISATDVTEGGQSMAGQMVRFALSDTLDVTSGGDVIAKTQAEVVLDANGNGSIRLPVYNPAVKTWCGDEDWAVLVTATWGSQKAIRVPAGTTSIALSSLPPVRALRGREKLWAITGVSVSVTVGTQAGQASGSATITGGIINLGIVLPPAGPHTHPQSDITGNVVTAPVTDYNALPAGVNSFWNTTIARDSGLPDPGNGVLLVQADEYQRVLEWCPTVGPLVVWRNARGADNVWSGWAKVGPDEAAAAQIRAALLEARTRPVKIAVVGDSISEGTGATTLTNRWQTLAQSILRTALGITAGPAVPYIPARYATPAPQSLVSSAGDTEAWDRVGLGVRSVRIGPGGSVTFTPGHITSARLIFFGGSTAGTAEVLVGGTAVGTVNTQSKGNAFVWPVPLTAGNRTITVRSTGDTSVYVQGIHVYDGDETAGLQLIDASHHGWAWQAETLLSSQSQAAALKALEVDGVVAALGTNDIVRGTPAQAAAAVRTTLDTWRATIPAMPVLQVWMLQGGGRDETTTTPYREAIAASLNADRRGGFFDANRVLPGHDEPGGADLFRDALHPNDLGHQRLGEALAGVLLAGSAEAAGVDRRPKQGLPGPETDWTAAIAALNAAAA